MKEKTDNELIAEFMQERTALESLPENWKKIIRVTCGLRYGIPPYDTSWDWLMPVVEKIESLGFSFEMSNKSVWLTYYTLKKPDNFESILSEEVDGNKILAAYKAVVEFIKWYNEEKSNLK